MSLETFFNNFTVLADAPNGVAKLRELILQLAVEGRLVPQEASDEPATSLAKRIQVELGRLVIENRIRDFKLLPVKNDEVPYALPSNWLWTRLGSIGLINPRNDFDDEKEASFVPMRLIPQAYGKHVNTETRLWGEMKKGFTHFAEGDVVLAKITPCFQNGKAAVMRKLVNKVGAGTTELLVFRPVSECLLPEYVLLYLRSPQYRLAGEPRMTGTAGQKRVPNNFFVENPFPLPPLDEQIRIVAKVDELMQLCDELEVRQRARRESRIHLNNATLAPLHNTTSFASEELELAIIRFTDNFDVLYDSAETVGKLRSTILQLAVQGKLVSQDLNDTTIRIAYEKENTSSHDYDVRVFAELLDSVTVPPHWLVAPLARVASDMVDCPHSTPKWTSDGKICVRTNQFRPGYLELTDVRFVSEETYLDRIQRLEPTEDDIRKCSDCSGGGSQDMTACLIDIESSQLPCSKQGRQHAFCFTALPGAGSSADLAAHHRSS